MKIGNICRFHMPYEVCYVDALGNSSLWEIQPDEVFVILSCREIVELSSLEFQILFQNKKMWFNIQNLSCNIEGVRRAGSYDIPFMTIQTVEPGSNNAYLSKNCTNPPQDNSLKAASHFITSPGYF